MNWAELLAAAALILASNVAIWLVMNSRLERMEGDLTTLRLDLNSLGSSRVASLERRLEQGESQITNLAEASAAAQLDLSAANDKIEEAKQSARLPNTDLWGGYVAAVAAGFSALHVRLDWHFAWLERLTEASGKLDRSGLKRSELSVRKRMVPRLHDLDLFSSSDLIRRASANELASGVGDQTSLRQLDLTSRTFTDIAQQRERLEKFLQEKGS